MPTYFITVCAENRIGNPLLPVAEAVLESVRKRNEQGVWYAKTVVVMPDHVHMLVMFPVVVGIATVVGNWKRYLARAHGVRWQANFFDHRIRNAEEEAEKFEYIRINPVKRGLCATPDEWRWRIVFEPIMAQELSIR